VDALLLSWLQYGSVYPRFHCAACPYTWHQISKPRDVAGPPVTPCNMISITRQAAVAPLQCISHAVRWVSGNALSAAGHDIDCMASMETWGEVHVNNYLYLAKYCSELFGIWPNTEKPIFGTALLCAKFYCPHALADGNYCIWIKQNTFPHLSILIQCFNSILIFKSFSFDDEDPDL